MKKGSRKGRTPRILLVGLGAFGRMHLQAWRELELEGSAVLAGAVVNSEASRVAKSAEFGLPVYTNPPEELLEAIDGVDIVTPTATHFRLASTCLHHAHVLVEKPLAHSESAALALEARARESGRILMVNHLYRFHPTVQRLKAMVARSRQRPRLVTAVMVNPAFPGCDPRNAPLELLHPFDILDYLFGPGGKPVHSACSGSVQSTSLRYADGMNALVTLGWQGERRIRSLTIEYASHRWVCDLQDNSILTYTQNSFNRIQLGAAPRPLKPALRTFAEAVGGRTAEYPDAETGRRITALALSSRPRPRSNRPRVAVIGGGIFGASCAIELAPHCDVTLFERHSGLLREATYLNQWRYHSGFHYPRSLETVQEIQSTRQAFESMYGDAVLQQIDSYYCTSVSAREITSERYLAVCRANELNFELRHPPPGILDPTQIGICLKTDEGVFDFERLREMVELKLARCRTIDVRLNTEVLDGEILHDGLKRLTVREKGRKRGERFDYVVNTTYANLNLVATWFGFPLKPLRFDLCEMLVVKIPIAPVSVTILDGPFTSLVCTGRNDVFILSQMEESVLRSTVPSDGLPPAWGPFQSNRVNMLRHASRYLPVLEYAELLESRFATRTVQAFNEDFDGRPTVVTSHGFGCWSVLGGKIGTCVSNARTVTREILPGLYSERG